MAATIVLGLGGCAARPQVVSVNLNRVDESLAASTAGGTLVGEAPISASAETLPALRAQDLAMGGSSESLERAKKIREKNRQRALQEIQTRLFEAAKSDAKIDADREKAALEPGYLQRLDKFYADARAIFDAYANPAGAVTLNLTEIVGFPDPDPTSRRMPDPTDKPARERFEQARELRDVLEDLSRRFWVDVDGRLGDLRREHADQLALIDRAMVERQDRLLQESQQKALEILNADKSGLQSAPLGLDAHLPFEPAATARVEPPNPTFAVATKSGGDWSQVRRQQLRSELSIWLATQGYRLAGRNESGRDATQEFIVWRKGTRTGP